MSIYDEALPRAFPQALLIDRESLEYFVGMLGPDAKHPNGSSYAVTADAPPDKVRLWLSDASLRRLGIERVY